MRARWTAALGAALALVLGAPAAAALAESPAALGGERVLDVSDVLGDSEEQAADERLRALTQDEGVDLWVVYVDEFENPADPLGWADATAELNGLGDDQYLLAIATEGRQLALSYPPEGGIGQARAEAIEVAVGNALGSGDWAAAVDTAADAFESRSSGGGVWPWIIGLVVVAGVVIVVVLLSRRRTPAAAAGRDARAVKPQVPTGELQRRAATLLISADDAITSSAQELGFAVAQFGEEATSGFRETLESAKAALGRAFDLKQKLDDGEKDTEAEVRAWNSEIITLCEQAVSALGDKEEAFARLRQLEQNAPEALAQVQEKRSQADGVVAEAQQALAALQQRYAPEPLATVADNPAQAQARLTFADEQLAAAQAALASGDGGAAAVAIRNAEQAIGQARALDTAIDELGASLGEAERQAADLIADIEGDLAAARQLTDADGRMAAAIARTEQQVGVAQQNLAGPGRRPLVMLDSLQKANAEIDQAIAGGREAVAAQHRTAQMLAQTIMQARSQVSTAEQFIAQRRGGVGTDARTRVAQAGADLARAEGLQSSDPASALSYAQSALQHAQTAIQIAQSDMGAFGMQYGSGRGGSAGGDILGGILGGIIGSAITGGGSRGGWGGGSSRRGSGGFGGGSRGGRSGGSSFGGSRGGGSRGGRSGGRRF